MLYWSLVFLVAALVAALLGFAGAASRQAGIARAAALLFLVVAACSLLAGAGWAL